MAKILVSTPLIPITSRMSSHRAAQGVIYADQLQRSRPNDEVYVNMAGERYIEDFNQFDEMYVYHGNDFSGSVNLFGGVKGFPYTHNFVNFSKFKGAIHSFNITFPDYFYMLKSKVDDAKSKGKEYQPLWDEVDWENLGDICTYCIRFDIPVVHPNFLNPSDKISIGDSHAICLYRPGWSNVSIPFRTLHGALERRLITFVPVGGYNEIEFYFGNIDIRHHLCRQENPDLAAREIAQEYVKQALEVAKTFNANVKLYEPLPIENESRSIPKTGWYKGTPFYGSWKDRVRVRAAFVDELAKSKMLYRWTDTLLNAAGELDFKYMEKPQSVHLSRDYYPHWQGREWNGLSTGLDKFL